MRTLSCLLLILCTLYGPLAADDKGKSQTVTDKDNGKIIALSRSNLLAVKLPMSAGTGFGWTVVKNNAQQLAPVGKAEIIPGKDPKIVGGPLTQVFRFEAKKAGKSELELHYQRPFEKEKPPAKTFKIVVQIGD